jgi:hypothetical protein
MCLRLPQAQAFLFSPAALAKPPFLSKTAYKMPLPNGNEIEKKSALM